MAKRRKYPVEKDTLDPDARRIGYARVSTEDQDLKMQIAALRERGVHPDYIFHDKRSGKDLKRPGLQEALHIIREGDVFIAWSLDRIGRNLGDLILVIQHIGNRKANLICIKDGIDTTTAIGMLYFHIVGAFAQFERSRIAERTSAGIQARKKEGRKFGRDKSLTSTQVAVAVAWLRDHIKSGGKRGKSVPQVAAALGCGGFQVTAKPPKPRKATKPTYGSVQRRLEGKAMQSRLKANRKCDTGV